MAEIRQSKVKSDKTLILSTCHICPFTPIFTSCMCLCWVICFCCQIAFPSSLRLMISLEQWRSTICCFFPVVGCELNVNARTCKHDVSRFISFVPVWLFHFVSGNFTGAVHSKSMYFVPTISCVNHMK